MISSSSKTSFFRWFPVIWGTAITVFWLVMMFTLLRDRVFTPGRTTGMDAKSVELAKLAENWTDHEEYMIVKMGPVRVGSASTEVKRLNGVTGGFLVDFAFSISLNILGLQRRVAIIAKSELDRQFDLSRFHIRADLWPVNVKLTGQMAGEELLVEFAQGTEIKRAKYKLDHRISLLDAVRPVATANFEIKPGNSMSVPVVDPIWSLQQGILELRVGNPKVLTIAGKKMEAFPVEARLNDFVSTTWVDKAGNTLRRNLVGNLTMERSTREKALEASEVIDLKVKIPKLNPSDFAALAAQPLDKLASSGKSPLSIVGSLVQ